MKIELPTRKNGIANLRVLASALYGPNANVETHYTLGKPNLYSVSHDSAKPVKAGELAEALRFKIELCNPEAKFYSEYNGTPQ
jgi:hypothetical protein